MTLSALDLVLFFVASSGIGLALLLSILLWKKHPIAPYTNQILALLIACLSLRILKSVFYNFMELPLWIRNFGLAFNLAIGPLLYFYGRSINLHGLPKLRGLIGHFLPSLVFFLGAWYIPNGNNDPIGSTIYTLILIQGFTYLGICTYLWDRNIRAMNDIRARWFLSLIIGIACIWLVYTLIFLKVLPVYMAGALSFSILIFLTGKWSLSNKQFLQALINKKYQGSRMEVAEGNEIFRSAADLVKTEKLFLEPNFPIASLADKLNVPAKQLSQAINQEGGHNYSYFMNAFRVKYAQQLLREEQARQEKLFFIALESGFNSLSSFNAAFKEHTGMTPSSFRKNAKVETR